MDKKLISVLLIFLLVISLAFVFARELEATVTLPSVPNTTPVVESTASDSLVYYLRVLNKKVIDGLVPSSGPTSPSDSGTVSTSVSSETYSGISFSNMSLGNSRSYCFYKSVPISVTIDREYGDFVSINGSNYPAVKSGEFLRISQSASSSCPVINIDSKNYNSILSISTSSSLWDNGSNFTIKIADKENKFTVGSNKLITAAGFSAISLDEIRTLEFDIGNSKKLIIAIEADTTFFNELKVNSVSSN